MSGSLRADEQTAANRAALNISDLGMLSKWCCKVALLNSCSDTLSKCLMQFEEYPDNVEPFVARRGRGEFRIVQNNFFFVA